MPQNYTDGLLDIAEITENWTEKRRFIVRSILDGRTWAEIAEFGISRRTIAKTMAELRLKMAAYL